jgi:hypothetical protein
MAPLGEWSLVAKDVVGARGMPDTVGSVNPPAAEVIPT